MNSNLKRKGILIVSIILLFVLGGVFFKFADTSEWGYVKNGELVERHMDATDFSNSGYALISDDCKNYYVIDSNLCILKDYIFEGKSASLCFCNDMFVIIKEDGTQYGIKIE